MATLRPSFRLSPTHNGSTLYDSFELRAVTNQLNKAMQASNFNSSPTLVNFLRSPFYNHVLDSIYKEGNKTPKKITCYRLASLGGSYERRQRSVETRVGGSGFVGRLWKKVKQGCLLKNKHRNKG